MNKDILKVALFYVVTLACVIVFSWFSVQYLSDQPADTEIPKDVVVRDDMTLQQVGQENGIAEKALRKAFGIKDDKGLETKISELNLPQKKVSNIVKNCAKNSQGYRQARTSRIRLKFILWVVFMVLLFILTKKGLVRFQSRKILYLVGIVIFGVFLGANPSPMSVFKNGVLLEDYEWGEAFARRMAFLGLLVTVILANKAICSWACQLGLLQDFIFRLPKNKNEKKSFFRQYKIPFVITNSVRVVFFLIVAVAGLAVGFDVIDDIDVFKVFKPREIGVLVGASIAVILTGSLFVYRPWCHLFCPFGLVGWVAEKISIFKIKVDYDKCIGCKICSKACPGTAMEAILERKRVVPDCFSCSTCIEVCPKKAIDFSSGKRSAPPEGKFDKKVKKTHEKQ